MQASGIQGTNLSSLAVLPQASISGSALAAQTTGQQGTGGTQTLQAVAQAQPTFSNSSGASNYNPNAPRGSYVNVLV